MTYQEAAQNLINLYAHYVEVCTANEENYDDFSEEIVTAVEALLIRADQDRFAAMQKNFVTNMSGIAPFPSEASFELLDQEAAFDQHMRVRDI